MASTGMAICMGDFDLGLASLRAFWLVQRWIEREREGLSANNADAYGGQVQHVLG